MGTNFGGDRGAYGTWGLGIDKSGPNAPDVCREPVRLIHDAVGLAEDNPTLSVEFCFCLFCCFYPTKVCLP